jgi:hypothetical protein
VFGLRRNARTGRRRYAELACHLLRLLIGFGVVLHQHRTKLFDRIAIALFLGELAVVDLGIVALNRGLDELLRESTQIR